MAIAYIENVGLNFTSATGAIGAFTTNVAVGDLVWACFQYRNLGGSPISPVITDGVNTGNYTIVNSDYHATWNGAPVQFVTAYIVANALGKPNVTTTLFSGGIFGNAFHFNGFVGTPTLAEATNPGGYANASTAINSGALTTSFANEMAIGFDSGAANTPVDPGGSWLGHSNEFGGKIYNQAFPTAGSNAALVATITSDTWYATVNSFYGSVTAPLQPFTSTQFFVTETIIQQ